MRKLSRVRNAEQVENFPTQKALHKLLNEAQITRQLFNFQSEKRIQNNPLTDTQQVFLSFT
jgi:glucose-6-phosphate-specific signal transduction histidine kinase